MRNPMDLTGKHILITGASSGIGRQCAVQAAQLGASVSIMARREKELQETLNRMENRERHAAFPYDLSDAEGIEPLLKHIVEKRGCLDGLCHAAGYGTPMPFRMMKPDYVEDMFKVNTFSFLAFLHCCGRKKFMNQGGSVVGISSVAAEQGDLYQGSYAATKAALNGVLHPASREFASRGIRVNNVAYAMVDTASYTKFQKFGDERKLKEKQCLGIIDLESAANAVMFLLSDACRYISGAVIPVYGGF